MLVLAAPVEEIPKIIRIVWELFPLGAFSVLVLIFTFTPPAPMGAGFILSLIGTFLLRSDKEGEQKIDAKYSLQRGFGLTVKGSFRMAVVGLGALLMIVSVVVGSQNYGEASAAERASKLHSVQEWLPSAF